VRVVLDTNVIVAAFAARGLCAEVFEVCLEKHNVIISDYILSEVQEKLDRKIRLPKNYISEIIAYIKDIAEFVNPVFIAADVCRDSDDADIIGTAVGGGAEFIITGDDDLLVLKEFKGIEIVTPRGFWERLAL
jgi:putative PIN family toxin of toxin-antitoxin system